MTKLNLKTICISFFFASRYLLIYDDPKKRISESKIEETSKDQMSLESILMTKCNS